MRNTLTAINQAIDYSTLTYKLLLKKCYYLVKLNKQTEALTFITDAIDQNPTYTYKWAIVKMKVYMWMDQYTEAINYIKGELLHFNNNPALKNHLIYCYMGKEDFSSALSLAKEIVDLEPKEVIIGIVWGRFYMRLDNISSH